MSTSACFNLVMKCNLAMFCLQILVLQGYPVLHATSRIVQSDQPVQVMASGSLPVLREELGVILYMSLSNPTNETVFIRVFVKQCCINQDGDQQQSCDIMKILGDHRGQLAPNSSEKIRFLYPTAYPLDLQGFCEVKISVNKSVKFNHTIHFDTTRRVHSHGWIIDTISAWLFGNQYPQICKSKDEDGYIGCKPVSCALKYHGHRNFFDPVQRKCVPVSQCKGDREQEVAYDAVNNLCENVGIKLSEEDVKMMTNTYLHPKEVPVDWKVMSRISCNHGTRRVDGSGCICEPGWTSAHVDFRKVTPEKSVYNMCNVKAEGTYWVTNIYILLITVSVISVVLLILTAVLYVRRRRTQRDRYKKTHYWSQEPSKCNASLSHLCSKLKTIIGTNKDDSMDDSSTETYLLTPPAAEFDHRWK